MAELLDLWHHGDLELAPGLLDLAVNVRLPGPPAWLRAELAACLDGLGSYPVGGPARAAIAARHGRSPNEVLLTAGAAEAFVLLARVLRPRRAVVVHPQFTVPEAALRAAGHAVDRVVLPFPYDGLGPAAVPPDADLVVVGNPTNPTAVLHPGLGAALASAGRVLVVDEAFLDAVPGEPGSLAPAAAVAGLPGTAVVVRSITKTWGLAGLRAGYVLAPPDLVAALAEAQPPWAVSTLAARALELCSAPPAVAEAAAAARAGLVERERLVAALARLAPAVQVVPGGVAPFVLACCPGRPAVRERLREAGVAVRRGDTFPGLGPQWWRAAVRSPAATAALAAALTKVLA